MNVSLAAARIYAKALFDIGVEGGSVDDISDELHVVRGAIGGLDPAMRVFFELPQLRKEDKLQVVDRAFGDRVGRPVQGLLHVLVEKRRESLLDTIVTEFDAARRRARRAGPGERHHRPRAQRRARRIRSAPHSNAKPSGRSCSTRASTPA